MLTLKKYKRSPNWYVRGTVAGVRIFETTRFTDRKRAERFRAQREAEIWNSGSAQKTGVVSFSEAAAVYVEHADQHRFVRKLGDFFKDIPIDEIDQAAINQAARDLYPNCQAATLVRQVYGPMSAILNHAFKANLPGAMPRKILRPRVQKKPVVWATDEYLAKLLPECSPELRALVLVLTYTGIRIGEATGLRPNDFNMRKGWVNIGRTKNGEPAFVPLPTIAQAAVEKIMPPGIVPVFGFKNTREINERLVWASKRAGVQYLSSHKIGRHAFAARLLSAGYDIKTVKEAGRWKDLRIVDETYGHLEQRHVHEAMLKVAGG